MVIANLRCPRSRPWELPGPPEGPKLGNIRFGHAIYFARPTARLKATKLHPPGTWLTCFRGLGDPPSRMHPSSRSPIIANELRLSIFTNSSGAEHFPKARLREVVRQAPVVRIEERERRNSTDNRSCWVPGIYRTEGARPKTARSGWPAGRRETARDNRSDLLSRGRARGLRFLKAKSGGQPRP